MMLIIPVDQALTYYDETLQIEGIEYLFEFLWSDRESCWYLNIYDQDETPIALWIKLVVSWNLLRRFAGATIPPGILFCADMSGSMTDCQVSTDLGGRVVLYYVTSDDTDTLAQLSGLPS